MREKEKKLLPYIAAVFGILILTGLLFTLTRNKLTYLECSMENTKNDQFLEISSTEEELVQEFVSPYEILTGIAVQIGTMDRVNDSVWEAEVTDEQGKVIFTRTFSAKHLEDNSYYTISPEGNRKLSVKKGALYRLKIRALFVEADTSLAFFCSKQDEISNASFWKDGEKRPMDLCLKIYGGDRSLWWFGFWWLSAMFFFFIGIRGIVCRMRNLPWREDRMLLTMVTAGAAFLLLVSFKNVSVFTDETDNIRGGITLARGGVLYRDYVTQHTPVMYDLCSWFAKLGAGSVEQFRLLFYWFLAAVWGYLYWRHSAYFGKRRMLFLPVAEIVFVTSVIDPQGCMILSDTMQGICMTALLLEFIRYLDDQRLGIGRSVLLSLCIWGSFGAAFVSVYALFFLFVLVVIQEGNYWITYCKKRKRKTLWKIIRRYEIFLVALFLPVLVAMLYFSRHQALDDAISQCFRFNTEVYAQYMQGFGTRKIEPVIRAFQNFFGIFTGCVNRIFSGKAQTEDLLKLAVMGLAVSSLTKLFREKKYALAAGLFLTMCCSATRDYGFHGIAAWYLAVLTAVLYIKWPDQEKRRLPEAVWVCLGLFLMGTYVNKVGNNLLVKPDGVSEMESQVIADTSEGDPILLDAWTCDSVYLLYKDRKVVNRNCYFLPWYMDWFEQDTIAVLEKTKPKVVLYDEHASAWSAYRDYSPGFARAVKRQYRRLSNDNNAGWMQNYWIRT